MNTETFECRITIQYENRASYHQERFLLDKLQNRINTIFENISGFDLKSITIDVEKVGK